MRAKHPLAVKMYPKPEIAYTTECIFSILAAIPPNRMGLMVIA